VADQPTKAMTLREAVEIVAQGDFNYCTDGNTDIWSPIKARRYRSARAIVNAAVEAHEADCENDDNPGDYDTLMKAINAGKKLRALERGEDPKP